MKSVLPPSRFISFLRSLSLLGMAALNSPALADGASGSRPNIIVILADDAGFADFGCFGGIADTPQVDRLAAEGMRFTRAFSNARCMPSRLALLTGLPPQLADFNLFSEIKRNSVTMAEVLRESGYATYMVGKWHLGTDSTNTLPKPIPSERGFDRFYGIWDGAAQPRKASLLDPARGNGTVRIIEDGSPLPWDQVPEDYYVTETWTDKAIAMIRSTPADRPFFLYLAHTAPHWPLDPDPQNVAAYDGRFDAGWDILRQQILQNQLAMGIFPPTQTLSPRFDFVPPYANTSTTERNKFTSGTEVYYAALTEMDTAIGRLMDTLEDTGRSSNTLVIFLSDNGADNLSGGNARGMMSNTPFNGYKLTYFEGGIATPMVAWWPGRIPANTINSRHEVRMEDFMATALDLSDAAYPRTYRGNPIFPLHGRSFLPALLNPAHDGGPRTWHWEHDAQRGVWNEPWKAIFVDYRHPAINDDPAIANDTAYFTADRNGWHLYNLADDRSESTNLASVYPERMSAMIQSWRDWALSVGWEPAGRWSADNPLDEGFRGTDGTTERAEPASYARFRPLTGDQSRADLIQVLEFDTPLRGLQSVNFHAVNPSNAAFQLRVYGANAFPSIPPDAASNPLTIPGPAEIPSLGTSIGTYDFGGQFFDWSTFQTTVDFGPAGYSHVTLVFHPSDPGQAVEQTALRPARYNEWATFHFTPEELAAPAVSGPEAHAPAGDATNWQKFLAGLPPENPGQPELSILNHVDGEAELSIHLAPGVIDQTSATWMTSTDLAFWQTFTPRWIGTAANSPGGNDLIRLRIANPDPKRSFYRTSIIPKP